MRKFWENRDAYRIKTRAFDATRRPRGLLALGIVLAMIGRSSGVLVVETCGVTDGNQ